MIKRIIKIIVIVVSFPVFWLGGVILLGCIFEFKPQNVENIDPDSVSTQIINNGKPLTILSWNIGYCGLGAEMDFFYDGGKKVKTPAKLVDKYSKGIAGFIEANDTLDFMIFQEVDRKAARSSGLNEIDLIKNSLPGFSCSFAINYQSLFVPVPVFNPMGHVSSGLLNGSRYNPGSIQRHAYQSSFTWPKNLFMPDRCFLVSKFQLKNGKELVIINTHNSAFDAGGKLKKIEMPQIRDYMVNEFSKGNYVVAGGDWNQNPPDFNSEDFGTEFLGHSIISISKSFFSDEWQFVFAHSQPTNRNLDIPWDRNKTLTTLIDFFIVSPNIDVKSVQTIRCNFMYSDHEPILLEFVVRE